MSIVIGTPVVTRHEFIRVNPWFDLAIADTLAREFESDRLKYKIREQINKEFPTLFRQHCYETEMWSSLRSRIDGHVSAGISQIQQATAEKVSALVENKEELSAIKNQVTTDINNKYDAFQRSLAMQNESAELSRNARLDKVEQKISDVKENQIWTFLGGAILGGVLGVYIRT